MPWNFYLLLEFLAIDNRPENFKFQDIFYGPVQRDTIQNCDLGLKPIFWRFWGRLRFHNAIKVVYWPKSKICQTNLFVLVPDSLEQRTSVHLKIWIQFALSSHKKTMSLPWPLAKFYELWSKFTTSWQSETWQRVERLSVQTWLSIRGSNLVKVYYISNYGNKRSNTVHKILAHEANLVTNTSRANRYNFQIFAGRHVTGPRCLSGRFVGGMTNPSRFFLILYNRNELSKRVREERPYLLFKALVGIVKLVINA